jgi:antirestriction factor ArdC-like protein
VNRPGSGRAVTRCHPSPATNRDWLTAPAILARVVGSPSGGAITPSVASFADLLRSAVTEPGIISTAYRQFHSYSLGNQLLAWSQCLTRGLQPGPLSTFMGWKEKGRHVRKGEKAITLSRPVTVKRTNTADDGTEETPAATWFVLAQTDGQELAPMPIPDWDRSTRSTEGD